MSLDSIVVLFETAEILILVAILFLVNLSITAIEVVADIITKKQRRWKDSAANFAIFLVSQLLEKTSFAAIGFLGLLPFYWLTPLSIPMTWWSWALAFLAADLTYYWMHRLEHEHRILWASHSVHHSSEDYNLTVGFRLFLLESVFEWIFLIPMILLGFGLFQTIIALVIVAQYQHWIHTERIHKLGWLDEVFNTPSTHRVHHGSNNKYLDKNYGGILMIWDKLFGTFQREEEKVVYGLTRNINTNNPVSINFAEFKLLWRDIKKCRNFRDKLKVCFGGLSYRPLYFDPEKSQDQKEM